MASQSKPHVVRWRFAIRLTQRASSVQREELIRNMPERVESCRRLADAMTSPIARKQLLEMAADGEADIRKLEEEAERSAEGSSGL